MFVTVTFEIKKKIFMNMAKPGEKIMKTSYHILEFFGNLSELSIRELF